MRLISNFILDGDWVSNPVRLPDPMNFLELVIKIDPIDRIRAKRAKLLNVVMEVDQGRGRFDRIRAMWESDLIDHTEGLGITWPSPRWAGKDVVLRLNSNQPITILSVDLEGKMR